MLERFTNILKNLVGRPAPRLRGFQLAPYVSMQDFFALPEGTRLVRYQFRVHNAATITHDEYLQTANDVTMHLLTMLRYCRQRGIKAAVCVMTPPAAGPGMAETLATLWYRIVMSIQAASLLDVVYGYDLLNEPQMSADAWNILVPILRRPIRALDKTTPLIISSTYGDPANLRRLRVIRDRRVIYTFHHYYPMPFTHQGVYEQFPDGRRGPTLDRLRDHLEMVRKWQQRHGVKIYVGEFSVARWADRDDALTYLRESINIFEKYRWDWTYHAWREWQGWDLEMEGPKDSPVRQQSTQRLGLLRQALER